MFQRNRHGELLATDAVDEYVRCRAIAGTVARATNRYRALSEHTRGWATLIYERHDKVLTLPASKASEDC